MVCDVWVTSGDPERNDILRLEDDAKATSDDPVRNDILRLDDESEVDVN